MATCAVFAPQRVIYGSNRETHSVAAVPLFALAHLDKALLSVRALTREGDTWRCANSANR